MHTIKNTTILFLLTLTLGAVALASTDGGVVSDAGVISETASASAAENPSTTDLVMVAVDLAKAGQWLLFAVALIQIIVLLIRKYAPEGYMRKWGSVTVAALSGAIAILTSMAGGTTWVEAVIVFMAGPGSSLVVDFMYASGVIKKDA